MSEQSINRINSEYTLIQSMFQFIQFYEKDVSMIMEPTINSFVAGFIEQQKKMEQRLSSRELQVLNRLSDKDLNHQYLNTNQQMSNQQQLFDFISDKGKISLKSYYDQKGSIEFLKGMNEGYKNNIDSLMETISNLQNKWAAINSNLLTLTSNVNDQLRSKNEEIRLNRQDAVYFRDYTHQIYNQMMDYVGDFLQRIWNKNHENELLMEKNKDLIDYCSDLNSRVAKFTLEINDLQNEKKMLMSKLINGESISQEPITREIVREVIREVPVVREIPISVSGSIVDDSKVEYYRNMAVDLNNRVAILSLNIDSLKINKYNEPNSKDKVDFYRNQAVSLNSNLAKLTLEINDYKNQVLVKKDNDIKKAEDKVEYYQKMAANLNTRLAMLSLEMDEINKPLSDEVTDKERYEYYQSLVLDLNSRISQLLVENENLRTQIQNINISQERNISITKNDVTFNDQSKIDYFRDLAVDLNSRLAKLSLEFNEKPKNVESINYNEEYIKKLQNQVVDLNQRLSVLTLNSNDEINDLKKIIDQKEQSDFKNKVVDLNQRLAVLTLNGNEEINNLKKELAQKEQNSFKNKVVDLNQRLAVLTLNGNEEINNLKKELAEKEQNSFKNKVVDLNQRLAVLTLNGNEEINNLKNELAQKEQNGFKNKVVDLNQRLAVLTLDSNNEINNLKKQLAQKESEVEQYRNKLAIMNRQIIDLTFNSNLESQQYNSIDTKMTQNRNIEIKDNNNYEAVINEKDLIIKQLQAQLAQMNSQNNNAALIAELDNEKRKNQELSLTINNMRNEMNSINDYLKETISVASSMESLPNANSNSLINEEITSIAEYIKETKNCLENYQKSSNEEINSLTNYLKDTINMAEEYKSLNKLNTPSYEIDDSYEKYDSEETVENQQIKL